MTDEDMGRAVLAFTAAWEAKRQEIGGEHAPSGTKTRAGLQAAFRVAAEAADEDAQDWCQDEDKMTEWDGEVCTSCGRVWGM